MAGSACSKHPTCVPYIVLLTSSRDKESFIVIRLSSSRNGECFQLPSITPCLSLRNLSIQTKRGDIPNYDRPPLQVMPSAEPTFFFSHTKTQTKEKRYGVVTSPSGRAYASEAARSQVLPRSALKIYLNTGINRLFFGQYEVLLRSICRGSFIYLVKTGPKLHQKLKLGMGTCNVFIITAISL